MFKIKITEITQYNKNENFPPYVVRYELLPDISKGYDGKVIHKAEFRSMVKAKKFTAELSVFLQDSNLFLDLIYTKLKQLELTLNTCNKYLRIDFNEIEANRVKLLKDSQKELEAYKHIANLKMFLSSLKYWCFAISKEYSSTANQLFKMLLQFENAFINCYRSAQQLSETKQLNLFI